MLIKNCLKPLRYDSLLPERKIWCLNKTAFQFKKDLIWQGMVLDYLILGMFLGFFMLIECIHQKILSRLYISM